MNEREKIAHLLRRFGLGAGKFELDEYVKLGLDGAIQKLIYYETVDEQFPISPWEMTGYGTEGQIRIDPTQFGAWWALRMVLSRRPLQEKLTLFWHNHFAISGEKVFDGPSVLSYQQTLRQNANGNFRELLHGVSKSAAMVLYLDTHRSFKGKPNENFAREVMELFTMGQGNGYTEQDIQQAARAFTGWGLHFVDFLGDNIPFDKLQEKLARQGDSVLQFCNVPALHDAGLKTILGKTSAFDGDGVLDLLCERPETAKYISGKLAKWFIGPRVSDNLNNRLAARLASSNLEIKPVLKDIAESDEFWADRNVRSVPKSPVDYYIAFLRQLGLQPNMLSTRGDVKDPYKPMTGWLRGTGDGAFYMLTREGLMLHYPPNVSGWRWGEAWISASNIIARNQLPTMMFNGDDKSRGLAVYLAGKMKNDFKVSTPKDVVTSLMDIFDGDLPEAKVKLLVQACENAGGLKALDDKERAAEMFTRIVTLLATSPEYQMS